VRCAWCKQRGIWVPLLQRGVALEDRRNPARLGAACACTQHRRNTLVVYDIKA
jgi:hypothetical protein